MFCKAGAWLDTLDDDDRDAFNTWPGAMERIWRLCVKAGFTGGKTSVKEHIKGNCCCDGKDD